MAGHRRTGRGGVVKLIPLTQGKFAMVDDEDFDELSKHVWYAQPRDHTWYAVRNTGVGPRRRLLMMHAVIAGYAGTRSTKFSVSADHLDHNGLNNQRANLRLATPRQQAQNRRPLPGGTSRYKGVSKHRRKWQAEIKDDGRRRCLGQFDSEEDAARAYDAAALTAYGQYAFLNFPRPGERSTLDDAEVAP